MSFQWPVLKSKLLGGVCLMTTLLSLNTATAADALASNISLELADSTSVYDQTEINTYYRSIAGFLNFSCFQQKFVNNLLISTYSTLPSFPTAPLDGVGGFLTAVIHDVSNKTLVKTSELRTPHGKGVVQVAVSPVAERPFIAVTTYSNLLVGGPYELSIYSYDTSGVINPTPVSTISFASFNADAMDNILTFTAGCNFSHDGKYLFYTQTLDKNHDGIADEQIFGILSVSADGTTLIPVVQSPAPKNGSFFFPQPDVLTIKTNANQYKVIAAFGGFTPGNLSAPLSDSCLVSYNFNTNNNTLAETGFEPLPGFIQGYDINPDLNRIVVVTSNTHSGKSVDRAPSVPHNNNSPDPDKSFRLYSYQNNLTSNALSYISGHEFDLGFWNVRWSHDGRFIAAVACQKFFMKAYISPFVPVSLPTGVTPSANCPSLLTIFSFKSDKDKFKLQDIKPAAAFSTNLNWSDNDKLIGISGQANPDLNEIQLYKVK